MPTFGNTNVETTQSGQNTNTVVPCKFTCPESGFLQKITQRLIGFSGTSTTQDVKMHLYADNAGVPGAWIASSTNSFAIAGNSAEAWYDFTFSNEALVATPYWLSPHYGDAPTRIALLYNPTTGTIVYDNTVTYPTPDDPFGTPTGSFTWLVSIYATYAAAPGDNPPIGYLGRGAGW